MITREDLMRRPLYVFDLPAEILDSLRYHGEAGPLEQATTEIQALDTEQDGESRTSSESGQPNTACALCGLKFSSLIDQRSHVRSDYHRYNLKQRLRGLPPVSESDFDRLVGDLDESLSGSDSSESDDESTEHEDGSKGRGDLLSALLKKQANLSLDEGRNAQIREAGPGKAHGPLIWFTSSLLPSETLLGAYRSILKDMEHQPESEALTVIRNSQLAPVEAPKPSNTAPALASASNTATVPHIFMCMVGGGHFAAMVVSLAPKIGAKSGIPERQASVLAHKTFHRYTTRRKQGGGQSSNDAAKGAAHSAGSSLRRYNEVALTNDIRALLNDWRSLIDSATLVFVRATGSQNRRTLFGPYDNQILRNTDPRVRGFPFSTRRATQAELMRSFLELTRLKTTLVKESPLANESSEKRHQTSGRAQDSSSPLPQKPALSKDEEAALYHTSQIQALIRRSKAPAVLSYFSANSLTPAFSFFPSDTHQNHHAPTPLHLAASLNSAAVVLALLTKGKFDPTVINKEGKTPFDLAGDRPTRDSFRVGRHELGEDQWDWDTAHIPSALSKSDADERDLRDKKESDAKEKKRREDETSKLKALDQLTTSDRASKGKSLGLAEKNGSVRREEETKGLSAETKMKLERERRARAAEERIKRMQSGQ